MTYSKEKWIAAFKKAVVDLKTERHTQGRVCATATVRYIRDGVIEEVMEAYKKGDSADDVRTMLKDTFNELVKQVSEKTEEGFASNASAAAKAAGYKGEAETTEGVAE